MLKHQSNFKLKLYCVNSDHNFQLIQFLFPIFFSARFARKQFQLEINTTQFSFRDPILSSSDTHSPLEIHIFDDPKDQIFRAARAIYTKKNTLESAAGAKTLHFNKIALRALFTQ